MTWKGPYGLRRRRPGLGALGWRLALAWPQGARVGESAVVSTQVHILDAQTPDEVTVLADRDAGALFYGRRRTGEIVHLDIFHAIAEVDCKLAAAAVRDAIAAYRSEFTVAHGGPTADYFDVQTGTGGGRVTGQLTSGRRASLKAAHRNHVHLAGRLMPHDAALCFYLVAAVETVLTGAGVEVRRIDRVLSRYAGHGIGPQDLSPYTDVTDTLLREDTGANSRTGLANLPNEEALLAAAARLGDELGGVEPVRGLLAQLAAPTPLQSLRVPGWTASRVRDAVARLAREGWVVAVGALWGLTAAGRLLERTYWRRLREVELAMRTAARRAAASTSRGLPPPGPLGLPNRRGRGHRVEPRAAGAQLAELSLPETVVAAFARQPAQFSLIAADLRVFKRFRPRRVDLCLLLDASASMEGSRMSAAKTLARNLLLTSRDRVAVMAFQERSALLAVPFTRNYSAAERGLGRIVPAGLTPLAVGLAAAREYLRQGHAKNPLLLLVTDGIPTVSAGGGSPLEDALAEAERIGAASVAMACIGLEPNERYLTELASRAHGTLHVVSELRPDLLARVARLERLRRKDG